MSTGRVLWIIWCLAWAGFWTFCAVGTFGLTLILTAGSVAAIWLPVGIDKTYRPPGVLPPCYRCGRPAAAHRLDGACPEDLTSVSGDMDVR